MSAIGPASITPSQILWTMQHGFIVGPIPEEEILVKYAAKITWPEKSSTWQHQGDAGSAPEFAIEFATLEQLGMDTEFVVMEKEGGNPEIHFFRVVGCAPYRVAAAESRAGSAQPSEAAPRAASAAAPESDAEEGDAGVTFGLGPVISLIIYMAKVAVVAIASIAILALLRKMFLG